MKRPWLALCYTAKATIIYTTWTLSKRNKKQISLSRIWTICLLYYTICRVRGVFYVALILEELKTVLCITVVEYQSNSTSLVQLLWSYTAIKWTGNLLMIIQHSIKNIFSYPYNQAALSPSPDTCILIYFMLLISSTLGELIGKISLRHEWTHQLNQTRGLNHRSSPAHSQWGFSFIPSVVPPVSWK